MERQLKYDPEGETAVIISRALSGATQIAGGRRPGNPRKPNKPKDSDPLVPEETGAGSGDEIEDGSVDEPESTEHNDGDHLDECKAKNLTPERKRRCEKQNTPSAIA